ncbi:efflux transporter outer membrane subunit [Luteibacter aegosomaticola]|uniref:efflux transporter outer membrane subunit n=1 Tax=Luteibacter aegosomaticola TaxID=2911538 RepID=UPI001FF9E2BB|nr:efflux transporter outer membrane subunit [Luteibacter aegosomaticola]UPG90864.1 efflux transporter outer membrane subunit [Luteibacter aegosomaticola]
MSALPVNALVRTLAAAGVVVALAACTVGPDYVRPSAPTPAAFKEAPAQASTAALPAGKWWSIYNDATLDQLVSQVQVNNQSLAASAARVREAEALAKAAGGPAYPSVGVGSFKSGQRNENDFGLGVSWDLDLWGRIRRDVEAHRASAQASQADLAGATLSMQARLVQSYFALREDDASIALLERAADVGTRWHTMVQNQYAQGQASSANVADALVRASSAQLQLADAKSGRAQLEHAIAVMLGKAPADFSIAPAPFDVAVPSIPSGVPATLLERRPDVVASERRMAAANARIGVAKAETLPSISLAAGIGVRRGPTGTVDAHAPLFAGGRLEAGEENANAAYSEAVANYRQTVLDAYREVEDGLVVTSTLDGTAQLHADAAKAATEADRVMQNQYREGVADYPAVVDAANTALNAVRGDLDVRRRRLDASVNLIVALGGGWQPEAEPAKEATAAR